MLIEHRGAAPDVHPSAYVAPNAVLCGAVRVGPDARILFGAVLTAEDGEVQVGSAVRGDGERRTARPGPPSPDHRR